VDFVLVRQLGKSPTMTITLPSSESDPLLLIRTRSSDVLSRHNRYDDDEIDDNVDNSVIDERSNNPLNRISTRIILIMVVLIIWMVFILPQVDMGETKHINDTVIVVVESVTVTSTSTVTTDDDFKTVDDEEKTNNDSSNANNNNKDDYDYDYDYDYNYDYNYDGPYKLVEKHVGVTFFDYYDFYVGSDSGGSDGYQTYVSRNRAEEIGLINVGVSSVDDGDGADNDKKEQYSFVTLSSSVSSSNSSTTTHINSRGKEKIIESLRLESKTRFNSGLLILDVDHVPFGCGVWPAFWTTDESNWPNSGEVDILETFNQRTTTKTALHTSEFCNMKYNYNNENEHENEQQQQRQRQPNRSEWTGFWEESMPIPDWYYEAGLPIRRPQQKEQQNNLANDCWVMMPYDWANQGCVINSNIQNSVGKQRNTLGGGIYVMEWDPINGYIKGWVFGRRQQQDGGGGGGSGDNSDENDDEHSDGMLEILPDNLREHLEFVNNNNNNGGGTSDNKTQLLSLPQLDPMKFGRPYSYFAIGNDTGCTNDHYRNHRIVINLAFCGAVSGNLFQLDCPNLYERYKYSKRTATTTRGGSGRSLLSSRETCEAYLDSDLGRNALKDEAYWKIRGVYLYQRTKSKS
jgi:hypothetical protein